MKAYITVGVSASGKSTWAQAMALENGAVVAERDAIRKELFLDHGGKHFTWAAWFKFAKDWARLAPSPPKIEDLVTERQWAAIRAAARAGKDVIISDTNLHYHRRAEMGKHLEKLGYEVETKLFPIEYAQAVKRDLLRAAPVGSQVIAQQLKRFNEQYPQYEPVEQNDLLPRAVICDIDGTLAFMEGRSPFDWSRVGEDKPNLPLIKILEHLEEDAYVFILSGRDSVCAEETKAWLEHHDVVYNYLYMRPEGDNRADTLVKYEMYQRYIRGKFSVDIVFDDRPVMCRMWRDMGLNVAQFGNPYIEF